MFFTVFAYLFSHRSLIFLVCLLGRTMKKTSRFCCAGYHEYPSEKMDTFNQFRQAACVRERVKQPTTALKAL